MKNNKIIKTLYTFFAVIGIFCVLGIGIILISNPKGLSSLASVIALVKSESLYEIDNASMVEGATSGIVAALDDPYSKYLSPEQWSELKLQLNAEFEGIGVYVVELTDGRLVIISPIKGTPAEEAGLKHGDIIIQVNGESAAGMNQDDVVHIMRGDPGTQLDLTVYRESEKKEYNFKIIRKIINVPSVEDEIIDDAPKIAYIRLNQFHAHSPQEMVDSLNKYNKESVQGLILDLRNNGGGDFDAAIAIANVFLDGKDVVSASDAKGNKKIYSAYPGGSTLPMVVLVNQNSASASEILAGALQDNGRSVLVGQKTYGKGLVQTLYPLLDGGALKLTTQKYFTPDGTDINEIGINPDYLVENNKNDSQDLQLQRAVEILKKQIL